MIEKHLEQICNAFQDAICITDKNGIIVLTNKKYADVYGFSWEAVRGKSVFEMERQGIFNNILNPVVIKTGKITTHVQHTTTGRELILEGHPIFDADGNVAYCLTFIRDVTSLVKLKEQLTIQSELLTTFQQIKNAPYEQPHYPRVVHSAVMCALYANMHAIAATDATVLLQGETGVGKDVLAHDIHNASTRANKSFIKVDCGSIPENLIETELFGYEAGTFSGANKNGKAGLIEAANGGTLFLDEIGDLPLVMQSRLLRVLQDAEVMRVGATKTKKMDVRFIAATNKNLEKEVMAGNFRSDLYYRLKVVVLHIPSLHQRKADILPLAKSFLKYYCGKYHKEKFFSESVEQILQNYNWPGNVRERENMIQGLVVTGKSNIIDVSDLPIHHKSNTDNKNCKQNSYPQIKDLQFEGKTYKDLVHELEYGLLHRLLNHFGSINEIAKNLKIDRSTVFRKVKDMKNFFNLN